MMNQEKRFFRLCNNSYREMIEKKRPMTLNDFDRIYYVLITLGMVDYAIYFSLELFPELLIRSSEQENERDKIYKLHYSQDDNLYAEMDKCQIWLQEFLNQMPLESQRKRYVKFWSLDMMDITDFIRYRNKRSDGKSDDLHSVIW